MDISISSAFFFHNSQILDESKHSLANVFKYFLIYQPKDREKYYTFVSLIFYYLLMTLHSFLHLFQIAKTLIANFSASFRKMSLWMCLVYLSVFASGQVLEYNKHVFVSQKGIKTERVEIEAMILSNQSRDLGDISIWKNGQAEFKLLHAEIRDVSGSVIQKAKKHDISVRSSPDRTTLFNDGEYLEMNLQYDRYPYILSYAYEMKYEEYIDLVHWYPKWRSDANTLRSTLTVDTPEDLEVYVLAHGDVQYTEVKEEGRYRRIWESQSLEEKEYQTFGVPHRERYPRVIVSAAKFRFGVPGSASSWQDFGDWFNRLNANLMELSETEKVVIDSLLVGIDDDREKVRALYQYLQDHTQYVNVSIGYGGFKSYPASYVCHNKYGDCKALTTFMKAVLNHAGIKSHYALINTGVGESRVHAELPSAQFNHIILAVPLGQDTLWLENTSGYTPYDYTTSSNQGNRVLVLNDGESYISRIRPFSLEDSKETRVKKYTLNESGEGTLLAEATVRGRSFEKYAYLHHQWKEKDIRSELEDYFGVSLPSNAEAEIIIADREDDHCTLKVQMSVQKMYREIGNMKVLSPLPMSVPKMESVEKRTQEVRIENPISLVDSTRYSIENLQNFTTEYPEAVILDTDYGSYSAEVYDDHGDILVVRKFDLPVQDVSLEDYSYFYEFLDSVRETQKSLAIILKSKT